ncbi:MAG TPA: hypothetical protein VKW76_13845 [Candidatus Binatia bacterium]|nr:hypothetical protein [Candidatus Binatia bacterium]
MRLRTLALGIMGGVLAARGVAGALTVADLLASPTAYDGRTVTVTGTVEEAVPVAGQSGYNLRDGAARVTVVSRTAAPANGDHVTVTATVHAFAGGDDPESKPFPPFLVETSRVATP